MWFYNVAFKWNLLHLYTRLLICAASSYIQILRTMNRDNGYAGIAVEGPYNSSRDPRQLRNCNFYNNTVYNTKGAVIHYAMEAEHSGFRFYHNAFIATDSLIMGVRGTDDVFSNNHWTGMLPDSTFH